MKCVIITVGDEILIGQVVNTNAAFIAERVNGAGFGILRVVTVRDDQDDIEEALGAGLGDAEIVILTGGLGPTHDDVTKRAVAHSFSAELVPDPGQRERIERLLSSRRMEWGPAAEEQTLVPREAEIIPNKFGTAAGLILRRKGRTVIALPGVPYEMEQMMTDGVLPLLATLTPDRVSVHKTLRTTGISETALAARLGEAETIAHPASVAFLPSLSGVRLRLTASERNREESKRVLEEAVRRIMEKIGRFIYGEGDDELEMTVGALLAERGLTIATAESCTGGMIAQHLTSVPGSSRYFLGSVVAYSNPLKEHLLGVDAGLLRDHGAVSAEVARAMAEGVRKITGADIGIASTGIAGPSGGSREKPVGLVFTAYADEEGPIAVRHSFGEGRHRIMQRATYAALEAVRRKLLQLT